MENKEVNPVKEEKVEKENVKRNVRNNKNNNGNRQTRITDDYQDQLIALRRVTKVTKGGRDLNFSATVAVGDGKGKIGIGSGKAHEVPEAIKKARNAAVKNVVKIDIVDNRTISHEIIGVEGAAKVLLKPAKPGTGVIAGGPVRTVLELAGIKDVVSKSLGSNKKINSSKATMNALTSQRSAAHVAKLRGKTIEEILG